jgi:hypothetical protein
MTESQIQANYQKVPKKAFCHVQPRYTAGSPALVPDSIALLVALDEVKHYKIHLEGVFGQKLLDKAMSEGLSWIVYARWEKGKKVYRLDLITGEQIIEPPRLEWDDKERIKILRNKHEFIGLTVDDSEELAALEFRQKIHRDYLT